MDKEGRRAGWDCWEVKMRRWLSGSNGGQQQYAGGIRRTGAEIYGQPEEAMRCEGGDGLWRVDGRAIGSS